MPKGDNKILKYNHGEKSMKVQFIVYADLASLLKKMSTCHNNPEKLSTTAINKNIVQLMLQKISSIIIEVNTV